MSPPPLNHSLLDSLSGAHMFIIFFLWVFSIAIGVYIIAGYTIIVNLICVLETLQITVEASCHIDQLYPEDMLSNCQSLMGSYQRFMRTSAWYWVPRINNIVSIIGSTWHIDALVFLCLSVYCFMAWRRNFRKRLSIEIKG